MAQTNIGGIEYTVKDSGKIDFSKPPAGKRFVPIPVSEEYIRDRGIDRRFVTQHRFSATRMLVVMELVDEEDSKAADAYIADIKAECQKEERKNRCKIKSPRTGREICCPQSISCFSDDCPMKQGAAAGPDRTECLDDMAEIVKSIRSVEDEAVTKIMWEKFKAMLRRDTPVLASIVEMDEYGYSASEIMERLGEGRKETSWYYYQWKRIRNRWREFNK